MQWARYGTLAHTKIFEFKLLSIAVLQVLFDQRHAKDIIIFAYRQESQKFAN